jgi:periplasmic divalent cation tolerance protein
VTGVDTSVALVTAPSTDVGVDLCRRLVEERLAACGNVVPGIRSIYRWEGRVMDEVEVLLVLKTVQGRVPELIARTRELHPYDVPEILVLDVKAGHMPYLEWVKRETGS